MKKMMLAVLAVVVTACSESPSTPVRQHNLLPSPSVSSRSTGMYIVVLNRGDPLGLARTSGLSPRFVYTHVLHGFAARLTEQQVSVLRRNPNVVDVSPDKFLAPSPASSETNPPNWGLDRIDQRTLPLDSVYSYDRTGAGVHVYEIDSGIRSTHQDLVGRVSGGVDFVGDGYGTEDCLGHGTHVAGIIGGTVYGTAKSVQLHPVRIIGCPGNDTASTATFIASLDWIVQNGSQPAVINISLSGDSSTVENEAVQGAITAGYTVVIAAGNGNVDACTVSPGSTPNALTIAYTFWTDRKAAASNWGSCVDLFAPGASIKSLWNTSDTATTLLTGSSMATGFGSGVAAMYLEGRPTATPQEVNDSLKAYSSKSVVIIAQSPTCNMLYSYRVATTGHAPPCKKN